MSLTSIIGKFFVPRQQELERHNDEGEAMQRHVLATLLESANDTEYGRKHLFDIAKGPVSYTHLTLPTICSV